MSFKITIRPGGRVVRAAPGARLSDVLQEAGIPLFTACGRRGVCGKCFIEVLEGVPAPPDRTERGLRDDRGLSDGYRLACRLRVSGSLIIRVPEDSLVREIAVLREGLRPPLGIDPPVRKIAFDLPSPALDDPWSVIDAARKRLRFRRLQPGPDALASLADLPSGDAPRVTAVLHGENELLALETGDTTETALGLAVDIGTTTVVVELVDLVSGATRDAVTDVNSQMQHGADVVSRIAFAQQGRDRYEVLWAAILDTLNCMIGRLLERGRIDPLRIYEVAAAGNTVMNHILAGAPLTSLSAAPYHAAFTHLPLLSASAAGFERLERARLFVVPNIRSFVGGDITAGLIVSQLSGMPGTHLFIDLGTNGEIVLKTGDRLVATSTAAGPAFEGMNLSCGMLALPGAVYKVDKDRELRLHTIGDAAPRGVCGTGVIDLIAHFLDDGRIAEDGAVRGEEKKISVAEGLALTQQDIREVQLAAAAVKSGIRLMLRRFRLDRERLDGIWLAGAFGSYLNIANAMRIGLLPGIDPDRVTFVGNSALAGARALLLSRTARRQAAGLPNRIRYLSLASEPDFQDTFIQALAFTDEPG